MVEKCFNRKTITMIFYIVSICLFLISIPLLVYIISIKSWSFVGLSLLGIAFGLMVLAVAVNRGNDVVINYENKEVISNIKFNNKENLCIPFDSIINVYEINDEKLKKEIKLKKYPKRVLVIERNYYKEYIPLKWFDEETVKLFPRAAQGLVEDIQNQIYKATGKTKTEQEILSRAKGVKYNFKVFWF